MSKYIDCINDQVKKLLSNKEMEGFEKEYETLVERYGKNLDSEEAAQLAAKQLLDTKVAVLTKKKLNKLKHIAKNKELVGKAMEFDNPISFIETTYQQAANAGKALQKKYLKYMDEASTEFSSKFLDLKRSTEHIEDVYRELMGVRTGNKYAASMSKGIRQAFDISHKEYSAAGGIIGRIDNYTPQVHNKRALATVDSSEWSSFIIDKLDLEKMVDLDTGLPFTRDKLLEMLPKIHEDIVTGGLNELSSRLEKGLTTMGGARGLAQKNSSSRFFVFKDAESFFEYNNKFGNGSDGLWDSIVSHIGGMANDTAILQKLGPNPTGIARALDGVMTVKGVGTINKRWVNGMFDVLMGRTNGGNEGRFSMVLSNLQNLMRSAYLGSASVSAITDTSYLAATAKINGLSPVKAMGRYFKLLSPGNDKFLAQRSLTIMEDAIGRTLTDSRLTGEAMGGRVTRWLAGATNRLSGLHHMTKAAANAISLEVQANLAEMAGKSFSDLDPDFSSLLKSYGINDEMWDIISKSKSYVHENGSKFLNGEDIIKSFPEQSDLIRKTALAVDTIQEELAQIATNEQTLRTRALTTGAALSNTARKGSLARIFASNVFMFKSFPMTVMYTHMLPSLQRANIPEATRMFFSGKMSESMRALEKGKFDHLAITAIGTTILGGAAIQMKQIIAGKSPKETDSTFWKAAMLQGGGAGIFGDVLFGDYSRFGRDPIIDMVAGPGVGLASDVLRATKGNFDRMVEGKDVNMARDLFKVAKRNTPLVNLWYTRLLTERYLTDNIEKMLDPKYHERRRKLERKLQKQYKQNYWWRKGESSPE